MQTDRKAYKTEFRGQPAMALTWDRYHAFVLPENGGNLISFQDTQRKFGFLREPISGEMDNFKRTPYLYGIPVLFPPNRYQAGAFTFAGRRYDFPVHELSSNTHLHGLLYDVPWKVAGFGVESTESYIVLVQRVNIEHCVYRYWPHEFVDIRSMSLD